MSTPRDNIRSRTPMRCPVCGGELSNVRIRDMGGLTATILWQIHAGECPEHGWFQAEVVSRPPREIFAVDRPFGVARRILIDGAEVFAFATVWNDLPEDLKRKKTDPLDPRYWVVRRLAYRP
jgi:hypothetical protein